MSGQATKRSSSDNGNAFREAVKRPPRRPALFTALVGIAFTLAVWQVMAPLTSSGPSPQFPSVFFLTFGLAMSVLFALVVHLALAVRLHAAKASEAEEALEREASLRARAEGVLRDAQTELERKVEERTAELSSTNRLLKVQIEERERAEESLRESEAQIRMLIETMNEGLGVYDEEGRITFANSKFYEMLGLSAKEVIGGRLIEFIDRSDRAGVERELAARRRREAGSYEALLVGADDRKVASTISAAPILTPDGRFKGGLAVFTDVTGRRQAEEELMRLAAVVEQMSEGVIVFDRYRVVRYVNPALECMSGYSRSEIIGNSMDMLGIHGNGDGLYQSIWESVETEGVWRGRLTANKREGDPFEVDAIVSPIRDASGQVISFVGLGRDVSHEVQLEGQLRQAQKTEALGTLAGGIAHDFNNILGAIIAFTELAQDGLPDEDPVREDLDEVLKAGLRGKSLIKQILTFSRPGEQERRPVELGLIVKEALRLMRASLPTTVEIRQDLFSVPAGLDVIVADPTEMHQVLVNLCSNSFHAMREEGGVLGVIAECVEIEAGGPVEHPELNPGPYVKLTVTDTGHGMTREVRERIFDPYFTTKKSGEGTGLGLSVVQGIVRSHGGAISVSSVPGQGTAFHIYLPKVSAGTAEEDLNVDPLPTGNERILFIDDEEALVLAGQRILEHLGYEVVTCTSGREAFERFRAEPHRFDLVISDQTMPQTTGLDLASKLLQIRPEMPIILYTGFSGATTEEKAKELGIREFILKPITTRKMAETVRHVLDGAAA